MSRLSVLLLSSIIVFAAGCTKPETVKQVQRPDCVFPDNPSEAAPDWVCIEQAEGMTVGAVGIYEKSGAGVQFMKDQAVASARVWTHR